MSQQDLDRLEGDPSRHLRSKQSKHGVMDSNVSKNENYIEFYSSNTGYNNILPNNWGSSWGGVGGT